jgi:prolyl oligopeptidase
MKDPENPEWLWQVDISEIDGRYLALYISKDTSRV